MKYGILSQANNKNKRSTETERETGKHSRLQKGKQENIVLKLWQHRNTTEPKHTLQKYGILAYRSTARKYRNDTEKQAPTSTNILNSITLAGQ